MVELDVTCALSAGFAEDLAKHRLDLAVYEVETPTRQEDVLYRDPTHWAMSTYRDLTNLRPTPVALFDQACWWRDAAIASLEARGEPYRIVCSSQSVSGVVAAVDAGVAIGLLGQSSIGKNTRTLSEENGFAPMPVSNLVLCVRSGAASDVTRAMASAIRNAFRV